jgi:hypothetical protein
MFPDWRPRSTEGLTGQSADFSNQKAMRVGLCHLTRLFRRNKKPFMSHLAPNGVGLLRPTFQLI